MTRSSAAPAVGDPAPPVALKATDGRLIRLSDLRGKSVVLYFYPKDDTPGCTREACGFRDARPQFDREDAVVLGVSGDDLASHRRFTDRYQLPFLLLSDPDASVAKAYGVHKRKLLYGRTYWGIERTTFLIDPGGRIAAIFPRVKVDGHATAVLEALRQRSAAHPPHVLRASPARP
jgi:peroxiredoxin Q/BCP